MSYNEKIDPINSKATKDETKVHVRMKTSQKWFTLYFLELSLFWIALQLIQL